MSDEVQSASTGSVLAEYVAGAVEAIEDITTQNALFERAVQVVCESVFAGGTVFWCGNGGSAADAQHLAAELVGRFELERNPIRSVAVTTDTSVLTALSNDYSYDIVFARQVQALAREGDVLIAMSTSGNSPNVVSAIRAAKAAGSYTIALTGRSESACSAAADLCIRVNSDVTSHIQEGHIVWGHAICRSVEQRWVDAAGN